MCKTGRNVAKTQSKIDRDLKKQHECTEKKAELELQVSVWDKNIATEREAAEEFNVEYIETKKTETSAALKKRIDALKVRIKEEEKVRGDEIEITRDYNAKKKRYEEARKYAIGLERLQEKLKAAIGDRNSALHDFRLGLATRTKFQFDFMLKYRTYEGNLTFDHDKGLLKMQIDPIQDTGSQALSANPTSGHTSALSGGERSFSTICFILALWEAMDCKSSKFEAVIRNPLNVALRLQVPRVNFGSATPRLLRGAASRFEC